MIYYNATTKEIVADVGTKQVTIDARNFDAIEIAFARSSELVKTILKEME